MTTMLEAAPDYAAIKKKQNAAWSAGALLRPLVQDEVFPTCAYVGGYGELAYHAELGRLRDVLHLPRTGCMPHSRQQPGY